ncbi:MAG TPA: ABC transporter ATP-binding protein [Allosphingosinicella sp.]|nr:ABC transporter ATP-binding protein [Allosphingosinicella sp.]
MIRARDVALPGRLEPLSLDIEEGRLVCLVGPNGSGKTSLLHAFAGIGAPAGEVEIAGVALRGVPLAQRTRLLSFLPASREMSWPLVARDVVALGGATRAQAKAAIDALELGPLAGRRIDRLSTGERSRVLIARALAPEPAVLLLDEPTANLDPLWQLKLMAMLHGRTAMVAMHDLDAAAAHADRLIVMDRGRVAADGPPNTVMAGPVIAAVFGIEKEGGRWRPLSPSAGPRSLP